MLVFMQFHPLCFLKTMAILPTQYWGTLLFTHLMHDESGTKVKLGHQVKENVTLFKKDALFFFLLLFGFGVSTAG